jgi:transcriptional regulator with XRE-family HTH domain
VHLPDLLRGRARRGRLTQTELAQTLDISQKRVSEIERGEVDRTKVDALRRYAAALGGTLRVEAEIGRDTYEIA